jgi:hypothetical protein
MIKIKMVYKHHHHHNAKEYTFGHYFFKTSFLDCNLGMDGYVGASFVPVLSSNYFGSACHLGGQGYLKSGW